MGSIRSGSPREPSFTNLVGDVYTSLDELTHAGEAVLALVESEGWSHVVRMVEAERAKIDAKLDGELLATRADYARETGRRRGLYGFIAAAESIVAVSEKRLAEQRSKHEGGADALLEAS